MVGTDTGTVGSVGPEPEPEPEPRTAGAAECRSRSPNAGAARTAGAQNPNRTRSSNPNRSHGAGAEPEPLEVPEPTRVPEPNRPNRSSRGAAELPEPVERLRAVGAARLGPEPPDSRPVTSSSVPVTSEATPVRDESPLRRRRCPNRAGAKLPEPVPVEEPEPEPLPVQPSPVPLPTGRLAEGLVMSETNGAMPWVSEPRHPREGGGALAGRSVRLHAGRSRSRGRPGRLQSPGAGPAQLRRTGGRPPARR